MKNTEKTRFENVEIKFNGFKDHDADMALLRDCVKTVLLNEQRAGRKGAKTAKQ